MPYIGRPLNAGNLSVDVFTGNASTTVFTLTYSVGSSNSIGVYLDGVRQLGGTDFTASGTTLTFTTAPANGVGIDVYFLGLELSIPTPADVSVTAAKIASNAVTTAKIIDDAVTLAKMAPGTDGNIISYDASGNPVAIATGTDGQVLTSAGAGAPPAFEAAAAGGKVLQVVYGYDATETTISGSSLIATGLTATITTSAANSKVLVLVSQMGIVKTTGSGANTCITIKLHQDSTAVRSLSLYLGYTGNLTNTRYSGVSGTYLSAAVSSASTSITFSTKALITTGGGNMSTEGNGTESSITLIEVSA
jgi:trimeric autotransporter adhesin